MFNQPLDDRDPIAWADDDGSNDDAEAYQQEREVEQREAQCYPSEGIVY